MNSDGKLVNDPKSMSDILQQQYSSVFSDLGSIKKKNKSQSQ